MIHQIAVSGYRSLRDLTVALGGLTIITGPNGSGKSSFYRAVQRIGRDPDRADRRVKTLDLAEA